MVWIKLGSYYHGLVAQQGHLHECPHLAGALLPRWPQVTPSESCQDCRSKQKPQPLAPVSLVPELWRLLPWRPPSGLGASKLGSLTPSVPTITGSHHVSSTWPSNLFPSGPSTPRLTIDQANNIFGLASKCQALCVRLAKDFQVLSGLEAIHCNSVQGTVHETLTLGHSAQEAAFTAILWDDITEAECEAMTHCLHSKADATWKEMHEVMYNHQLKYDWWLAAFLKEAETTLANMRDQVWTTIRALTENEGITFKDCLSLMLHILHLLPLIPMDILFQRQIPLTIAYCPESSIYRRWHPEQGRVSPLHKEVRACWTLTKV